MSVGAALVATVVLLILNGFFVAAEFALVAARRASLRERAERGSRSASWAVRLTDDLSGALAGAQLGITMASLGLGFVSEPALAGLIEAGLEALVELPEGVEHAIAIPIALTIVVYFHMVFGEMVPKNIAISTPEAASIILAPLFWLYMLVFRPAIAGLNGIANGVLRLLRIDPVDASHRPASGEDLGFLISASRQEGFIEELEHRLLTGALTFSERDAAEVMIPRNRVVAASAEVTPAELEQLVVTTGHSRIPVYRDDLDHIVGFVHHKDLLRVPESQRERPLPADLVRPIPAVPESARLDPVLLEMRRDRAHLAVVIDEHGGTAGIVTLEDVIEELVGDIRDEHDRRLGSRAIRLAEDRFRLSGMLRLDEVAEVCGLDLPEGEYATLGGFIMTELGRLPSPGDQVEHDGWVLEVRALDGRRVDVVEAVRKAAEEPLTYES